MLARASPTSTHCAVPSNRISPAFPMSVAGLRYARSSYPSTPLETRSGSYINAGEPSTFHDWEFRTSMRLKLYEDAIRAKSRKPKGDAKSIDPDDSDGDSRAEEARPTRAATAPVPSEDRPDMEATPAPADGSSSPARPRVATPKSDDSGSVKSAASALPMDESTPYAVKARTEMVHRVLEGLRDEAFELARDIGIDKNLHYPDAECSLFPRRGRSPRALPCGSTTRCPRTPRRRVDAVVRQPATTLVEVAKVLRL